MKIVNSLTLITSHGTQEIAILEGQRLIDSLIAAQIPWSALSFYTKRTDQKFFEPFTGLHITGEFLPLKR